MTEPSRPSPPERGTTLEVPQFNTLPEPEKLEPETPETEKPETEKPETEKLGPEKPETEKSEPKKPEVIDSKKDHDPEKAAPSPSPRPSIYDFVLLSCILIMLIWPWIFFGVVWAKKGIQMNNRAATVVTNNPHATTYIITLICTLISMIVTTLFSLSIIRLAQELVTRYRPNRPFHLRALLALRHQSWPWGKNVKDLRYLTKNNRWWLAALVVVCILTFPHLVSTTTSLITPIQFNRTATLTGFELDFASTDPACLDWFGANPIPSNCDWVPFDGQYFSNCLGENQVVDVLEAGRGNILELVSDNSQTLTFSQLGADDGLHFLGSIRGVLPIGPNGVQATLNNSLEYSPLSDPAISPGIISYDYTFNHQGLASNISCNYEPTTPIEYGQLSTFTLEYDVPSCAALGQSDILTGVESFNVSWIPTTNTLMYWACQSAANDTQSPSYSIYLFGFLNSYAEIIGNITCTVSPMQPATYPVTYQSTAGIFSVGDVLPSNESATYSPSAYSFLVNYTYIALGGVISEGQNFDSNLVAESVITFGVKDFGLAPYQRNDTYLKLYENMIQGILEYETSYVRLIYSLGDSTAPPNCIRTVTGSMNYVVLGWYVTKANIGFLIPLTIINGAALTALLLALGIAKGVGYLHPRHPREVEYDRKFDEEVPDEWKEKVDFHPTSLLKENLDDLKDLIKDDGEQIAESEAMQAIDQFRFSKSSMMS